MKNKYPLLILVTSLFSAINIAYGQWATNGTLATPPLTTGGKVGIGVSTPSTQLHIQGVNDFDGTTGINLVNGANTYGRTQLRLTGRFYNGNGTWDMNGRNNILFARNSASPNMNVGSPGTDEFAIQHNLPTNELGILSATSGSVPLMVIQQNGNVGIGAVEPKTRLDLGPLGGIMFRMNPGSQTNVNYNSFQHHDLLMGSYLDDGLSNAFISTGYIQDGRRKFHIGSANSGTFATASFQPHFTVTSDGKVGIGTKDPSSILHLSNGTTSNGSLVQIQSSAPSQFAAINLINDSGFVGLSIGSYGSTYPSGANYARPNGVSLHTTSNAGASAGIAIAARNTSGYITLHSGGDAERMRVTANGNVGIGTTSPNEKLTVYGTIYGKEVKVDLLVPGPDYVFEKNYNLPTLEEIKNYIDQHKHLPEVPSAKEMEANGINVGEMNMILLKKVEELTLYVIELKKENEEIKKQIKISSQK